MVQQNKRIQLLMDLDAIRYASRIGKLLENHLLRQAETFIIEQQNSEKEQVITVKDVELAIGRCLPEDLRVQLGIDANGHERKH